jgi:hypothetical protein
VGFEIEQTHEQLPVHRQPQLLELAQQTALGQRGTVQPQGAVAAHAGVMLVFAAPADAGALEFPAPVTQQGLAAQGAYQVGGKIIGRHGVLPGHQIIDQPLAAGAAAVEQISVIFQGGVLGRRVPY